MRGDHFAGAPTRRAGRPLSAALLGGVSLLAAFAPPTNASAQSTSTAASPGRREKSIVISTGQLAPGDPELAIVTDQADECPLEPINRSTGAEPELARNPQFAKSSSTGAGAAGVLESGDYVDACEPDAADFDQTTAGAETLAAEALPVDSAEVRPASFNGVTPGVSTREELVVEWGEPALQERGRLTYHFENFPRIDVQVVAGVVTTIRVSLPEPVDAPALAAKLGLSELAPAVAVTDDGAAISTAFPARGVTLLHQPQGMLAVASDALAGAGDGETVVYEIELAGITAAPFVRRAENAGPRDHAAKMADLQQALELDGASARTRYLLSQCQRAAGAAVEAESLAAAAVELDETSDVYRLQWATCLKDLAQYDAAVDQTRKVLESPQTTKLVRAEALNLMGRLAALGSRDVQQRAVPLHAKAIELADQLANAGDPPTCRAANALLVDAHLATAERLAAGQWQDKDEPIAQWVGRPPAVAEQMIADGQGDEGLRLQVAVAALRAGAKLNPPIDPKLWIAEAEQAAEAVKEKCDDDLGIAEIDWQLALAYSSAVEIQHRRGMAEAALEYGSQAEQLLATLAVQREQLPDTGFIVGRLFFQIGAVHAVHLDNHSDACEWYDRALEPLLTPTPVTPEAAPGQHGDALVSMGVSFWNQDERERAYELTQAGLELIQQGVAEGLLDAESLKVPESNLAAMGQVLGKKPLVAVHQPKVDLVPLPNAKQSQPNGTQRQAAAGNNRRMPQQTAARRTNDGVQRR